MTSQLPGGEPVDRKQLNLEVDKTLDAYRELDAVNVSDTFFEGVQRKIRQAGTDAVRPVSMMKLSLASTVLAVLLLVNGLTLFTVLHKSSTAVSREAAMMTLIDDYAIRTSTIDFDKGTGGY